MTISPPVQTAIEQLIDGLCARGTPGKYSRKFAALFLELPDKEIYPDYYIAIPEPRCINGIRERLRNKKYKMAEDVFDDLILVMLNAQFYNEGGSVIWNDADILKRYIETNWKSNPLLPPPRTTPNPASPQKKKTGGKTITQTSTGSTGPTIKITLPKPFAASSQAPKQPAIAQAPSASTRPATPATVASTSTISVPPKAPAFTPLTRVSPQTPYIHPTSAPAAAPIASTSQAPAQTLAVGRSATPAQTTSHAAAAQSTAASSSSSTFAKPYQKNTPDPADLTDGDDQDDKYITHLERGLPKWRGPSEDGFTSALAPGLTPASIIEYMKDSKGPTLRHKSPSDSLIDVPEEPLKEASYLTPLSLRMIDTRAHQDYYQTIEEFDRDMTRLFEKARRFYEPATTQYGHIITCQRMFQQLLTSSPPASPATFSPNYFSSIPAGPGTAKPPSPKEITFSEKGVPQPKLSNKARKRTDNLTYKGQVYSVGDWVHLSNPDDPMRPIVGQVYRTWVSEEKSKKGRQFLTVCWYFRPEQTIHFEARRFFENEVFRSAHFVDHAVEDLIEKIAIQCTSQYVKGRPRQPNWYPWWPLYVCDSIYNDIGEEHSFVKIKTWGSCLPEEIRSKYPSLFVPPKPKQDPKTTYMPIYPFEQPITPRTTKSPFLRGVVGPGTTEEALEEKNDPGRRKTRRAAEKGAAVISEIARADRNDKGTGDYIDPAYTSARGSTIAASAVDPKAAAVAKQEDRSVLTAAGGMMYVSSIEKLPPETSKLFDRDPITNEVLWFSGPPIDIPRPRAPQHSLEYLHFLAKKRKRERAKKEGGSSLESDGTMMDVVDGDTSMDSIDVDAERPTPAKMPRKTLTQMVDEAWDEWVTKWPQSQSTQT